MLSIAHTVTGAYLASQLPHPALYVPLTLAAHYFQDWIPHWDVGTGLSTGKRKRSTALILEIFDLIASVALVYFLFQFGKAEVQWHVWIASFVALLPDFIEAPRNFFKWEPFFIKPLNAFHNLFHHSTPNMVVGLSPQMVLLIAIALLK